MRTGYQNKMIGSAALATASDPVPALADLQEDGEMRTKIGECGVDDGMLMVGDPGYFWPNEIGGASTATEALWTWGDVCDALNGGPGKDDGKPLHFKAGHAGLGVIVETTHGDGCYPVYLETTNGRRRIVVELD